MILYRPVNQAELDLIAASGYRAFPPRLPDQPIFYPVLNEAYAAEIAEKWNVPAYGAGFVLRFEVEDAYIERFAVQNVGGSHHEELWVPAEELAAFNQHIIGTIDVVASFDHTDG
mgnify:FL=1